MQNQEHAKKKKKKKKIVTEQAHCLKPNINPKQ